MCVHARTHTLSHRRKRKTLHTRFSKHRQMKNKRSMRGLHFSFPLGPKSRNELHSFQGGKEKASINRNLGRDFKTSLCLSSFLLLKTERSSVGHFQRLSRWMHRAPFCLSKRGGGVGRANICCENVVQHFLHSTLERGGGNTASQSLVQ